MGRAQGAGLVRILHRLELAGEGRVLAALSAALREVRTRHPELAQAPVRDVGLVPRRTGMYAAFYFKV